MHDDVSTPPETVFRTLVSPLSLSLSLSVFLLPHTSASLRIDAPSLPPLSVCLSVCPPMCLSVCLCDRRLSVYLSLCLSI